MINTIQIKTIGLLLCASLFSPSLVQAEEKFIWKAGANQFIKLTKQEKSSARKNSHPAQLNVEEISTVLSLLKIQGSSGDSALREPVFIPQQASILGQYIAQGLRGATVDQDIIFAMEKSANSASSILKSDRFFVAGRAFYADNKLNILIGDHNRPRDFGYESAVDPTHVGIVHYNFNYGHRAKPSKSFREGIVEIDGVENKRFNNIRRADWLVIDTKTSIEAHVRETKKLEQEEMAKKRKEIKEILASGEPDSTEEGVVSQDQENAGSVQQRPAVRQKALAHSMEERFTILKGLKDKGLISDEEYANKRKQLLDEL